MMKRGRTCWGITITRFNGFNEQKPQILKALDPRGKIPTRATMATKWFVWIYIHGRPGSMTGSRPEQVWQMGVCQWNRGSDHIFAIGNPDCFHKQVSPCWDSQPQVQLFRLLSHLLSGLKWTVPGKHGKARINQVKQVRSESGLTKCPFLIKFNGIYLNKIDQQCHQCAPALWQKRVV